MSNKLKWNIDAMVGEYNWYIAGGAAAYWHIDHYVHFGPNRHLHDLNYYESIQGTIFPHDVEGNAVNMVEFTFDDGKYGPIDVTLQPIPKDQFDMSRLEQIDGIYVYTKAAILQRYYGAQGKVDKRNLRIALLRIIDQGLGIDAATVRLYMPAAALNLGGQINQGMVLNRTDRGMAIRRGENQ